jgi:eukaryotic-like serine/threonine-protein kinase
VASEALAPGTIVANRLRVVQRLGEGGMGCVYEVEHLVTKHHRALKVLRPELVHRASLRERFLREASAAGRIGNAHIVETYDAGELEAGEPYLLMELLDGRSLAAWLGAEGRLSPELARDVVVQACDGLEAAHRAGIIHRDVKADNLFIVGQKPFVKLLDFGISKFDPEAYQAHTLTVEGTPMGTPYYMPPELVRGEAASTAQSDIYSLGVVFYECLTGKKPFMAASLPELSVRIHEGRYTPASELVPGLPKGVDAVIARALALEPERRYASARAFAEELEKIGFEPVPETTVFSDSHEPVRDAPSEAPAPGVTEPPAVSESPGAGRPWRGPRWLIALLGVGFAVGVVALVRGLLDRDAEQSGQPSATVPPEAPPLHASVGQPRVSPQVIAPDRAERADAEPGEGSAGTDRAKPRTGGTAASAAAPPASSSANTNPTRAQDHKLDERDPF